MPVKSLVMWSGGLDSTYGLVRLLSQTKDEVHAHHIHRNARHDTGLRAALTCEYEAEAVENMRTFIGQNYRPFRYSESHLDLTSFSAFARDTTTTIFFAAQVAKASGFDHQDRILLSMNSDEDIDWNPGSDTYGFLRMVTIQVMKLLWNSEEVPYCFLWPEPPSKQTEADFLPLELFGMTASCRAPERINDGWKMCGSCAECETLSTVQHHTLKTIPEGAETHAG